MSDIVAIKLQIQGDAKAAQAIRKEIEQLAAASQKTSTQASAASAKQAQAYAKIQTAAAQAATANQKLATETQKTATAAGTAATAAQRLATEQQRTAVQAANAAKAQNQAAVSAIRLAQAQQKAGDSSSYFSKVGDTIKSSILGMVGPAAIVTTAIAALKGSFDLAQVGASVQGVEQSFQSLAASGGRAADELLAKMNAAAQGTISDAQLMQSANTGMLLTNGKLAAELPKLIEIARASARATGQEVGFVFDSLVRGIARGSPLIIDNAGITLNAAAAFETYAASIGKSADQLTKSEQQQATLNAVMASGDEIIAKTGGMVENNAQLFAQSAANVENAKNRLASLLADGIAPVASGFGFLAGAIAGTDSTLANSIGTLFSSSDALMQNAAAQSQMAANAASSRDTMETYRAVEAQAVAATTAATQAVIDNAAAMQTAAAASVADTASKAAQAAVTQLLEYQTRTAAESFLALNPNIDAAGVASLVAAGKIDASVASYVQTILVVARARAELAALQKQAGVAAGHGSKADTSDRGARSQEAAAIAAAQRDRTLAIGTTKQKIALYQQEYQAAVKRYGAESAQAYAAQTKILQAQQSGGKARASAAGAAAEKLASIEQKTGDKIAEIVENTQQKLTEIAEREAAKQRAALNKLNEAIATSAADRRASNEADDLDLIGKDMTAEEAARLNDRERAQAKARESEQKAAEEARAVALAGDAELAEKQYGIREKQIGDQQSLDEKYAEKQRELAGNDKALAAAKTQYDEATRANEEAAQRRIEFAQMESAQRKQAVEDEKNAVVAAAEDQANKVVSAATRSAEGVKKATGDARAKAVADLQAIGSAVNAIPTSKTITITVNQEGKVGAETAGGGGGGGGGGGPKAAGGGTFMTRGRTTLTVGDNPGGRELVTVTPLSGRGQSRASGNLIAMAGGGQVVIDAGGGYTTPVAGTTPTGGGKGKKGKGGAAAVDPKKALDELKNTIQMLMDMAKLKEQIAALKDVPAFDIPTVQALANRAQEFTVYVFNHLVPITKKQGESLDAYFKASQGAAGLISDMASLKKDIAALKDVPAFDQPVVLALIDRAQQFTAALQQHLIPLTEFESELFSRYAGAVGDTVGILSDLAGLKKDLAEPAPPISTDYIWQLVADAAVVTVITRERLVPTTEEQSDAMSRYASSVSDSVGILGDVIDLKKDMTEAPSGPISDQLITRLADEAVRVATIVKTRLVPSTKEEEEGLSVYADTVGSSVSVLKDVLSLSGELFTDYASPSDAQIGMLASDAQRVARGIMAAASTYSKEGLEAGKLYAEGVGTTFSAFKDGLLFFDALKSGDFKLDTAALAQFESATVSTLETARRLGAVAATIPSGDISALQTTTAALAAQSEALIKLAAVPFGDLPAATAGLAQQRNQLLGGGGTTTIYNTFNLPPGSNQQTVDLIIRQLNQQMGMRR